MIFNLIGLFLGIQIMLIYSCKESERHYDFFFISSENKSNEETKVIADFDSIVMNRMITKTSYTIDSHIANDSVLKKEFLKKISKNNFLTITLSTPFNIKSDFNFSNLNIKVFKLKNHIIDSELKLHSVFISDLQKYYNLQDFVGKQFSDFDSIKIKAGNVSNNILMMADYDLSGVDDTIFVVKTIITIQSAEKNTKMINSYDTIIQKTEPYNEFPYKVH